jgi:response regulator of citrate/malate metabolism
MVSANAKLRHIYEARDNGVTDYIAKPYTANDVYKHLASVVKNHRHFVDSPNFFGPDRRRRVKEWNERERRAA